MSLLTVNLEERLIASKDPDAKLKEQLRLEEAEAILAKADAEKLAVLGRMGLSDNITKSQEINSFNERFDSTRVFTTKEIKSVCVAYGLRFLPTSYFKGSIDPELPGKILEFERKHPSLAGKKIEYHIAAPKASFKLQARPKDPLVFAKIGEKQWFLVHKWGNDLSIMNWLVNLPLRTDGSMIMGLILSAALANCVLFGVLFGVLGLPIELLSISMVGSGFWVYATYMLNEPNVRSWKSTFS